MTTHDDELVLLADYPLYHDQAEAIAAALLAGGITEAQALREGQRLFGICSDPDCEQPIAGYYGHGPKLCAQHLALTNIHEAHVAARRLHDELLAAIEWAGQSMNRVMATLLANDDPAELLAHLVDDGTISSEACSYCWGTGLFDPEDQNSGECMWCDGSGQRIGEQRSGGDGA